MNYALMNNAAACQTTTIETITPDVARKYLEKNLINRKLRRHLVKSLAGDMARGCFILSHQGIAFNTKGHLIDGQHRLNAVVEAGVPVVMSVTRNVDDSVFKVTDIGAKRNIADSLRIDRRSAEVLAYIVRVLVGSSRVTPSQIQKCDALFGGVVDELLVSCGTAAKFFACAPVRAAAVLRMYMDNSDVNKKYVLGLYRDLVLFNVKNLPPVGISFTKQSNSSTRMLNNEKFARGLIVFDISRRDTVRIQINEIKTHIDFVREKLPNEVAALG